jgi:hypothetical protein
MGDWGTDSDLTDENERSEQEGHDAADAWIDPDAVWRINVSALNDLHDGGTVRYYYGAKSDGTTLLVLVTPVNERLDGWLDITAGSEHGIGTMTKAGGALYTSYERHLTNELFERLAADCGLQVASGNAPTPSPTPTASWGADHDTSPRGMGRILDETSIDQQAIQRVNIDALNALGEGEEVRYYFAGKADGTTLLVLIVPDNQWLDGGLDITNGDEHGVGTMSKHNGVLHTTYDRHRSHPLFMQLAAACGLASTDDAQQAAAADPDPDELSARNIRAVYDTPAGASIEYFICTVSDGRPMLVVGSEHDGVTWQRLHDAPYERGHLYVMASPTSGQSTLYAVDAPAAARGPLNDLAAGVQLEVSFEPPTEPAVAPAVEAPVDTPQSPTGLGHINAVDEAALGQANIAAVRALGDRQGVEYWIGVDDAGDVMLVVGREHTPLVYQALQARQIDSGYLEYREGQGTEGALYAHNAPQLAEEPLRALANHKSMGIIYFSEQDQPFLVPVDLAQLEALNRANVKATSDGASVRFEMFEQEGSRIFAIGDGHPDQFQMLTSLGTGRIVVTKARRFQRGAGTLNVHGARPEDQELIKQMLEDFSDKQVVFETEDEPAPPAATAPDSTSGSRPRRP